MPFQNKILNFLFNLVDKFLLIFLITGLIFVYKVKLNYPEVDSNLTTTSFKRIKVSDTYYKVEKSWLRKNQYGVWEMYLEGKTPYERGLKYGILAKEIIESQEEAFVTRLNEMVPGKFFQKFLTLFVAWMNRDMDNYIPKENLEEIYGISQSFSDKYDYIGPKFYRILYYHAAHDIGHALADMRIVGCTSFALKGNSTENNEMIIGRNFDFYMGDEFAQDKLMLFEQPDSGYLFCSYAWAGFTGVVSGMNEKGLTVTLNAAKSDIPTKAKEPISLLAREIIQYAKNIQEAVKIAESKETFVSETLLIGSAADNKTVIIEKSPNHTDVYETKDNTLVCANHYQSNYFKNTKANLQNIKNSDSKYRFDRMTELINQNKPFNYLTAAKVLRDVKGENNQDIGLGNPRSINQLIAYHSVIFKPQSLKIWISTYPYQLGEYLCYDLNEVKTHPDNFTYIDTLTIPKDTFLNSNQFKNYNYYKAVKNKLLKNIIFGEELNLSKAEIAKFISSNPNSYETYFNLARYFENKQDYCTAKSYYKKALTKAVASKTEENNIKESIKKLNQRCTTK